MDGYILAVDLGTSKVVGALARRTDDEKIEVIGVEEVPSKGVRLGVVSNASMLGGCLIDIFKKLQNYISGRELSKVYVALGGHTLASNQTTVEMNFGKDKEITVDDLKQIYKQNIEQVSLKEGFELIESSEMEMFLDGQLLRQESVVGESCSKIEVHFLNTVCSDVLSKRVNNALERAPLNDNMLQCAGITLLPRTLDAFVSDKDAELGCAVIDFGAETTSLLVYQGSCVREVTVIPFGGKSITNDLKCLNLTEAQAEKIKIEKGQAVVESITEIEDITISSGSQGLPDVHFTSKQVAEIISARLDEIIEQVCLKIDNVDCFDKLGAGIIITGGGSNLNGIDDFIAMKTGMNVRYADCTQILSPASKKAIFQPKYGVIAGMLSSCTEDCTIERPQISTDMPISQLQDEKKSPITATKNNKRKKSSFSTRFSISNVFEKLDNVLFEKEDEM